MNWQILLPEYQPQQPEWVVDDFRLMFFKCLKWQFEETMDPTNCPYHYFCDSLYPGNYSPSVDILVLILITVSYFATLVIMVTDMFRGGKRYDTWKRYSLPSGPIFLPLIILTLAKGFRVNTIFPLSVAGPAILQLVHISALSFDGGDIKDNAYVLFEASTISGILHASLYLDSILLPYYTGLDALTRSNFSGACSTCVCREDKLVVGGTLVVYRGWSVTTFFIVGALFYRIICRVTGKLAGKALLVSSFLEGLGWVLIIADCVYLSRNSLPEKSMLSIATFGGIFVLICLQGLKRLLSHIIILPTMCPTKETW